MPELDIIHILLNGSVTYGVRKNFLQTNFVNAQPENFGVQ